MSLDELKANVIDLSKKAISYDKEKDYVEAFKYYKKAVKGFLEILKYEDNLRAQESFRNRLSEYLDRAEIIFKYLEDKNKGVDQSGFSDSEEVLDGPELELGDRQEVKESVQKFSNLNEKKWTDVVGLENARKILQEAFVVLTNFPEIFGENLKPWKGILLYGASGTGKTLLAKACATEANANFFSVCFSDLFLQNITESERLLRNLFDKARTNTPSILFISKIDKLQLNDSESESYRRLKTELLIQMDIQSTKKDSVLVIASSNTPWDLDPTIRRRFTRRIYIPLPDEQSRRNLFSQSSKSTTLTPIQILKLSKLTESFSCSQITKIIELANDQPRRNSEKSAFFKKTNEKFIKCAENDPDCIAMKSSDIPPGCLLVEKANFHDFFEVIKGVQPVASFEDLSKFREFTENFGLDG